MKKHNKNRKKNLLALLLSALMLTSATAALASCAKDAATDSSTTDSEEEETVDTSDDLTITNGNFATFTDSYYSTEDGLNAIGTSVNGWTRSTDSSALSSKAASGIIDTSADAWKQLTGSYYENPDDVKSLTEAEAESVWGSLTVKDKLAYYEAWKDANSGTISEELESFYESFNIDEEDIPAPSCGNPKTHADNMEDSNILMIHNEYPSADSSATYKSLGTAQKYTSSTTVNVPAGAAAQFSVWVKTSDLMSTSTSGAAQEAVDKGAYIRISHSVGGTAMDAYEVKNINTKNVTENNGWVQYSFYLRGSSFTDTTFSVVLGLGQGGGKYRLEYVNGYAFFDDIQCEIVSSETYEESVQNAGISESSVADFDTLAKDKIVNAAKTDAKHFALDFVSELTEYPGVLTNATATATTDESGVYTSKAGENPAAGLGNGIDGTDDKATTYTGVQAISDDAASNKYLKAVYDGYFKDNKLFDLLDNDNVLMLMSVNGVAYTAKSQKISFSDFASINDGETPEYLAISFFVRTSNMQGKTGAGITLTDEAENETSFSSIDTTEISTVAIGDNEDYYDGWQQCFFFVANDEDDPSDSFYLTFNFGPTEISVPASKEDFLTGFAAFAGLKVMPMSQTQYECATEGTYAKLATVSSENTDEAAGNSGFDSAASVPSDAIEKGLATLKNYKGVYSNSYYVSPMKTGETWDDGKIATNEYANAGLISREYFADYYKDITTSSPAWLQGLKQISGSDDATATWNKVFGYSSGAYDEGSATQPLFIWNDGVSPNAYGFIGNSTSIAANSYAAVSLRVKVSAGAKASVYLIDTDDESYQTTLSIGGGLIYWYDDDGNICTGDPDENSTEIAFKLQSNGLYKANTSWSGYSKLADADKNAYFANLDNYAEDDDKNKIVADGGASHDYSDYWKNDGMDGIAFYYKNGSYYADSAYTVPVKALSSVSALAPRYEAQANQTLRRTVTDTNGEWAIVTFYLHTGDEAKNYRLEVWSGERTNEAGEPGAANPAGSYVIFDKVTVDAESNFSTLLDAVKDKDGVTKFESVFSYFDSAKYLRYDETLDENGIGNLYADSYTPSAQTEGIAYLAYENGLDYTVFADYSYSEITVTPTAETEEEETENTTTDDDEDGTNVWLLVSSIAIAVVLLLAILSIAIRHILKKTRKNRGKKARKTVKKTRSVKEKKTEKENAEEKDEDSPYND